MQRSHKIVLFNTQQLDQLSDNRDKFFLLVRLNSCSNLHEKFYGECNSKAMLYMNDISK